MAKKNKSATRYAQFIAQTVDKTRQGLNELGKDTRKDYLVLMCRIFAVAAGIMAVLYGIRTMVSFGLIG